MGIGVMTPVSERTGYPRTPRFTDIVENVQMMEAIGLDSAWFADHFVAGDPAVKEYGVWEGWTTMAGVAAVTSRIQLGIFVNCVLFRNPGVTAKQSEMLDEISNGRFILGLGAGWHEADFSMFGLPFDKRVSRFEEGLKIISSLVREGTADFQGEYYQANDARNIPRGPSAERGGVPILIGTKGPRMMGLAARYADVWNSDWHPHASELLPMLKTLDEACEAAGRDPKTMIRTSGSSIAMPGCLNLRANPITGSIEEIAERIAGFRDLGLKHYVAGLDPCTPQTLEHFARIVELLDKDEGL
jgi:alkanesulfonate monooxygenase SsuD/methylene tetrahydromethanopterin reductase-like flavin-dependent oxidoreductase (luciferase family)